MDNNKSDQKTQSVDESIEIRSQEQRAPTPFEAPGSIRSVTNSPDLKTDDQGLIGKKSSIIEPSLRHNIFNGGINRSESQNVLPTDPTGQLKKSKSIRFVDDPSASVVFKQSTKKKDTDTSQSVSDEFLNNSIQLAS